MLTICSAGAMNRSLLSANPSDAVHACGWSRAALCRIHPPQCQDRCVYSHGSVGVTDFGGLPEQIEAELKPLSQASCLASSRWGTMVAGVARTPAIPFLSGISF